MDSHLNHEERMNRVEEVILEFGLTKCANTYVGDPSKNISGISGGERKRLSFAAEVHIIFQLIVAFVLRNANWLPYR